MNVYDPEKQSTKFDDRLLVADIALQCIKCVPNISCLWRSPRETFSIYKRNLVFDHEQEGADFFPFSLKTGVPNEYQLIATNHVSSKIYLRSGIRVWINLHIVYFRCSLQNEVFLLYKRGQHSVKF